MDSFDSVELDPFSFDLHFQKKNLIAEKFEKSYKIAKSET